MPEQSNPHVHSGARYPAIPTVLNKMMYLQFLYKIKKDTSPHIMEKSVDNKKELYEVLLRQCSSFITFIHIILWYVSEVKLYLQKNRNIQNKRKNQIAWQLNFMLIYFSCKESPVLMQKLFLRLEDQGYLFGDSRHGHPPKWSYAANVIRKQGPSI